ncbi:SSI family serine proteinase inhibitor [Streptomyces syringium]|uniref:SSI family serine proteinase inhibitor n=1 Tax=Streptomyces syringium TaxID=76729 RepID=UPI0033C31863
MSVRTAVVVATAAALTVLPLAPADAGEPGQGRLFLTVSGARDTWIRGVQLACPGPGHHPHAREACADLKRAHGDPGALTGDRHLCTREYDPVTAGADGTWHGRVVNWRKTFPNACALESATGHVFRF